MCVGTRDNNDGNLCDRPIGPLSVPKCPAVHHGHPEIEEDHRSVATGLQVGQRFLAVACLDHDEAFNSEESGHRAPHCDVIVNEQNRFHVYFVFAVALRRSAQYFVIRAETALRAAADIRLVRFVTCVAARTAARRGGSFSSGNVRSIATISARSRSMACPAPTLASSLSLSALSSLQVSP